MPIDSEVVKKLKFRWKENSLIGFQYLDQICQKNEDDQVRKEAVQFVASQIRGASIYRRRILHEQIETISLMCQMYISYEFRSNYDTYFPRVQIFYGTSRIRLKALFIKPRHCYLQACGRNKNYNLGIESYGQPVHKERMVNVPKCQKVCMSNRHTLFLTLDGKLYGCGISVLLTLGYENVTDEYVDGHFVEPKLLILNATEYVEDILVTETSSLFVTNQFLYVIGSCPQLIRSNRKQDMQFVSHTSKRYFIKKSHWQISRFTKRDGCIFLEHSLPQPQMLHRSYTINDVKVTLPLMDQKAKIKISHIGTTLSYLIEKADPKTAMPCEMVLNGRQVPNDIVNHNTSHDGKIVVQLKNGILARGHLEIFRLKRERYSQLCADVDFEMKMSKVVAVLDEIPGTYGVDIFCCSPDGENLIFQIGRTPEKVFNIERQKQLSARQLEIKEEFERAVAVHLSVENAYETTKEVLPRIREAFRTLTFENSVPEKVAIAIEFLNFFLAEGKKSLSNNGVFRYEAYQSQNLVHRKVNNEDEMDKYWLDTLTRKVHRSPAKNHYMTKLFNICKNWGEMTSVPTLTSLVSRAFFQRFLVLAKVVEDVLNKEIEAAKKNRSGKCFEEDKKPHPLKTQNITKILQNRIQSVILQPNDIPLNLEINVYETPDAKQITCYARTNSALFQLMYPYWEESVKYNNFFDLWDDSYISYFFHRTESLAVTPSHYPFIYRCNGCHSEIEKINENGYVFFRVVPDKPVSELVRPYTRDKDIWYLESSDGELIPVHRYIIMLHSCQIMAAQSYESARKAASQGDDGTEENEMIVIQTGAPSNIIRIALVAVLDMTTLYDKDVGDVIAVLEFYDYHLMVEAFDDALEIVFQMFNDKNLDCLYWLFLKYEEKTTPYLFEHSHLILMSASEHVPPRRFIERFCAVFSDSFASQKNLERHRWFPTRTAALHCFEWNDTAQLFLKMPDDLEKTLMESFAKEWHVDLSSYMSKNKLKF